MGAGVSAQQVAMNAQSAGGGNPGSPSKATIVTAKLFKSLHAGYGDSFDVRNTKRMEEYTSDENTTLRYNRVHGSMDARWPGEFRMGQQLQKLASSVAHDLTPVFAIPWTDSVGVFPAIIYLVGKKIMMIRFGVVSEVGSDALGSSNVTGGMFDDDGSGVPYLYAAFGAPSSSAKIRRMTRAQVVTTSADVYGALLLSLNGKAYRTIQPTSGTSACQVSVCPYGLDRFSVANWGTATTVGFAGTDINALVAVRNAVVAVKPEGVFAYNQALDQWINYTPAWRSFFHLDNGKGAYFLGDSLVIPMGDGGAVVFDGNNVKPFDPGGLVATPNAHTTVAKFTATGAMRHWIIGATAGPAKSKLLSLGSTLKFLQTVDDAAFTDDSANVRDLNLSTGSTLPANAALKIYIGWDRPFTAVRFDTGLANAVARTMTVKVGTAPATYTTVGAKNTGFRDFTELAGAPLGQSANIVLMVDPVQLGWVQTTVNGITAYWMQLTFSGAMTASVSWVNCLLTPWSPSVDVTNFPLDGLDKSGNFPHLLYGRQDQQAIWHDMVSLPEPDEIGAVLFGDVGGTNLNHSRNLVAIGRFGVWTLSVPADDRPGLEQSPFLNANGLIEGAMIIPQEGHIVRLKTVRVDGHELDPTKFTGFFYYTWDYGVKWSRLGSGLKRLPEQLDNPRTSDRGYRFRWAFGFKQSAAGACLTIPTVDAIEADFEILPGTNFRDTGERALATLPRF